MHNHGNMGKTVMLSHIKTVTHDKSKFIINSKKKEDQSNSMSFFKKYENINSISSLLFLKSIKIFAEEEKKKK